MLLLLLRWRCVFRGFSFLRSTISVEATFEGANEAVELNQVPVPIPATNAAVTKALVRLDIFPGSLVALLLLLFGGGGPLPLPLLPRE